MVGKKFRKTQRIRKTLRSCKDGRRRRKTTPSIFSLLFFFQWHIFPFSQKNASLRLRLNSEKCVFVYFTGCCSPPPTTGSSKQLQFIYSFWSESSENVGEIITFFFHVIKIVVPFDQSLDYYSTLVKRDSLKDILFLLHTSIHLCVV